MDWQKGQPNDLISTVLIFIVHINLYVPVALHCYGECRTAINNIYWSISLARWKIFFTGLQNAPQHKVPMNLHSAMEGAYINLKTQDFR